MPEAKTMAEICEYVAEWLTEHGTPTTGEEVFNSDAHGELAPVFEMYTMVRVLRGDLNTESRPCRYCGSMGQLWECFSPRVAKCEAPADA